MSNSIVVKIGKKIRQYREEAGISQKKLGTVLGLSDKAISAYESSRTIPPIETLERIARELGKPLELFVTSGSKELLLTDKIDSVENQLTKMLEEIRGLRSLIED